MEQADCTWEIGQKMKKELDYFRIGNTYGGNQDWFKDFMMKIGGCAALTACDSCIYFDTYQGTALYPFDRQRLTKEDYIRFGMLMKPYLRPRWSGIDTLEIYMDGFQKYIEDRGCETITMNPLHGDKEAAEAETALKKQIDSGLPVPCLLLRHKKRAFKDYEWHWFLLTGYSLSDAVRTSRRDSDYEGASGNENPEQTCMVKAVTYGGWQWLDFRELWNTGYERRGGLVLYRQGIA